MVRSRKRLQTAASGRTRARPCALTLERFASAPASATPSLLSMRALQITRFGGRDVLDVV